MKMNLIEKQSNNNILFNACFDKNQIKNLVSWYLITYGERITIQFLERLKTVGFHQATLAGISLGIEDLQIPPDKPILITKTKLENEKLNKAINCGLLTNVEKSQYLIEIWNQTSDKLRQTAIQNFKLKNPVNPVYMMAFSGARGNVSQVRQLIAMRGLMADPQGAILEFPIQSNFREGLTITEYLISCYGARKGLVDTALRTATSGYLTRRLVDSAQQAVVAIIDCQTKKYRILEGYNLEKRLIGRVLATDTHTKNEVFLKNKIIDATIANLITNEHIAVNIRSPLTCEATTSICQFCYGWNLSSSKLVQIGDAVGVIAAQSIGEPGTQLTMRTFHTGGVGVFSDQALKPIYSPFSGYVSFPTSLPGHFVRTPKGEIVYMLKTDSMLENSIILEIKSETTPNSQFTIFSNQLPSGSILFVKQGEFVQSKQLLAQASFIKITKQQLPESSYPVYSQKTGQIFYESMNLIIEKEKISGIENSVDLPLVNSSFNTLSETRRMAQMGSFWVLESSKQQNITSKFCFVKSGDLVSPKTIITKNIYFLKNKNSIQLINNKLTFGVKNLNLEIKNLFFKNGQIIYKPKFENIGLFINKKYSRSKNILIWYLNTNLNNKKYYSNSFLYNSFDETSLPQGLNLYLNYIDKKNLNKKIHSNKFSNTTPSLIRSNLLNKSRIQSELLISRQFNKKIKIIENINNQFEINNWPFIVVSNTVKLDFSNQILPPGKCINGIGIPNFYTYISPMRSLKKIPIFSTKTWYNVDEILTSENFSKTTIKLDFKILGLSFKTKFNPQMFKVNLNSRLLYKSENRKYLNLKNIINIEKYFENSPICTNEFKTKLQKLSFKNTNSDFIKQAKTPLNGNKYPNLKFKFIKQKLNNQNSLKHFFGVKFIFKNDFDSQYSNTFSNFKISNFPFERNLSIFNYYVSALTRPDLVSFKTFNQNLVYSNFSFGESTIRPYYLGEIISQINTNNSINLSILNSQNLVEFKIHKESNKEITNLIRWGDEIETGIGSILNGQIIKQTRNSMSIRLGIPILASARGIVHVNHGDLVDNQQLIITLKSRRLQTEDIVQGIPKIEQLFEARESQSGEILNDTVHLRLRTAFVRELELLTTEHWSHAVERSFLEAQNFLVENIETAYANQGVKISEKHIEVIVRQMTSRVRILESGETGLLPGELVQHNWIRKFNKKINTIGLREATYEPIVLGISKSVLQSESFLLAASFQEVSRVLIKSSLSKKRDFLQGLHENVIVGQSIPAGTGLMNPQIISNLI